MSFYTQAAFLAKLLQNLFPEVSERISFLSGIQIFARNLSFLSLLSSVYAFSVYFFAPSYTGSLWIGIAALLGFGFASFLAGLLQVYSHVAVLFNVYVLCCRYHGKVPASPQSFEQVVDTLIAASQVKTLSAPAPNSVRKRAGITR